MTIVVGIKAKDGIVMGADCRQTGETEGVMQKIRSCTHTDYDDKGKRNGTVLPKNAHQQFYEPYQK